MPAIHASSTSFGQRNHAWKNGFLTLPKISSVELSMCALALPHRGSLPSLGSPLSKEYNLQKAAMLNVIFAMSMKDPKAGTQNL
jgi:hypothetical protein